MKRYYIAYGSNLNLKQMAMRCPTAKPIGKAMLEGYELTFKSVATIEPNEKSQTPVAVWEIQPRDELALDRYEGYPHLYRKEELEVAVNGKKIKAMVYIMNSGEPKVPHQGYYKTIEEGYNDVGLDLTYLKKALEAIKNIKDK